MVTGRFGSCSLSAQTEILTGLFYCTVYFKTLEKEYSNCSVFFFNCTGVHAVVMVTVFFFNYNFNFVTV